MYNNPAKAKIALIVKRPDFVRIQEITKECVVIECKHRSCVIDTFGKAVWIDHNDVQ